MKNFLTQNKIFIIAEAGVNHNGRLDLAKKLVEAAVLAGCDAIKFQTFKAVNLVSKNALMADYQKKNTKAQGNSQYNLIKNLELSFAAFKTLKAYCDKKGIIFLSTPFDEESADFLEDLKLPAFKISSGDLTNLPFLRFLARKGQWLILSTGMSNLAEIKEAVQSIYKTGNKNLILLHCVTDYPPEPQEMNLKAIETLKKTFKIPIGFSDHSMGIEMSIAAAALGAQVIEKHLTLDRKMKGPDHKASLEGDEFALMVQCIRNVEKALGDGVKVPSRSEKKYIPLVRKSIVALRDVIRGERINLKDITIKRPGHGIAPKDFTKVIGRTAKVNIKADDILSWSQLK